MDWFENIGSQILVYLMAAVMIAGLVWFVLLFEKRRKKAQSIVVYNKRKLLINMPELEVKNNEIIFYEENWTIDQFSNAEKLRDLFVDYCDIGGVIRIVRILGLNIYLAVMPVETEDSVVIMYRSLDRTLMGKLQNRELTLEELRGKVWDWSALEELEAMYKRSEIRSLVQHTKEALDKADGQTNQKNKKNERNKGNKKNK